MFIFLQNKKDFRHNLYTPNPNHTPPLQPIDNKYANMGAKF